MPGSPDNPMPDTPSPPSFFSELKRRRVFRVAAAYAVIGWLLVEIADVVFPALDMPAWSLRLVILLVLFGFPIALVLAWAFDLTPAGPRRSTAPAAEQDPETAGDAGLAERRSSATPVQRTALVVLGVVVVLVLAGALYVLQQPEVGEPEGGLATIAGTGAMTQLTFSAGVEEHPAFGPAGDRLAISREVEGYKQIYVRSLATGQEVQLTDEPVDHIQPAWAPDGTKLLYVRARDTKLEPTDVYGPLVDGDIWQIEFATEERRLFLEEAYHPAYSPDGSRVAFDASWSGARRIWVADSLGHNSRPITTGESEAVSHISPNWSPDGRKIVFQNVEKTKLDIGVVDLASGRIVLITDDLFNDIDPVWSPRGDEILFSSPRGGGWNIWRIRVTPEGAADGLPRQITTGAGKDLNVAVSPDGRQLAFAILSQNADIWRLPVSPDSGVAVGPADPLIATTREESRAAWAPDGRRVAFNSDRRGEMNLWLHNLDEGATQQLTSGAGGDYQPRWSPDGRTLAFFSSRAGNADIWTVDVETGQLQQLTRDPALDVNPFFSPDGRTIAFQSDRDGRKELWVMYADGSNPRQLSNVGVGDHFLLWTEDSRSILVNMPGPGAAEYFLDGSQPRQLPHLVNGAHMSFSPDGSLVLDVSGHHTLWVSPLAGGEPRPVYEFDDPEVRIDYPVWSPDGRWIVFDRHRPTGGDIWILDLSRIGEPVL